MSRSINRLSPKQITQEKPAGMYPGGAGLYLLAGPTGAKSWVFRHEFGDRGRNMGLGSIHTVTLKESREKAAGCRKLLLNKCDPQEVRREVKATEVKEPGNAKTFKECAVASCLSNLDALITAETQKLEALKTHKKGLMQQLFPSPGGNR